MKLIADYYTGFEGEPEISFVHHDRSGQKFRVRMWMGYFDSIMEVAQPTDAGWKGLSYYYHTDTGWFNETPWQIPDINDAIREFQNINITDLDQTSKEVYESIYTLLEKAQSTTGTVWIEYD